MDAQDDSALVEKAQAGDRQAFAALVRRHYALMFKTAWHYCGNREEAEDIAQEAAIKLARNLGAFRFESAFTTWLYRLVINTAKDSFRAKNRRSANEIPLADDGGNPSGEASPEQLLEQKDVQRAVAGLAEDLKDTVILCYWRGLSHKDAAGVLGCSEGTVSWRLHEARKKLGLYLEGGKEGRRHG